MTRLTSKWNGLLLKITDLLFDIVTPPTLKVLHTFSFCSCRNVLANFFIKLHTVISLLATDKKKKIFQYPLIFGITLSLMVPKRICMENVHIWIQASYFVLFLNSNVAFHCHNTKKILPSGLILQMHWVLNVLQCHSEFQLPSAEILWEWLFDQFFKCNFDMVLMTNKCYYSITQ